MPVVERGIRLTVEELRRGRALLAAGDDMDKLADETEKASNKFKLFTQDSKRVQTEIEKSTARVKDLRQQLARTGDTSLFGDIRKEEARARNFRNLLTNLRKDAEQAGTIVGATVTNSFGKQVSGLFSGGGELGGPALAAAVAVAGPPLAAAIGGMVAGAVVGGVGTVGIVGGVLAASHDPRVKSAFQGLLADAKDVFFGAGSSFVEPTIKSVGILDQALHKLDLNGIFAAAAPSLEKIARGLAALVENVLPGLNTLLGRSGPFADAAAKGFAYLGTSLSEFLDNVSASPGAVEGLEALFAVLGGTIKMLGVGLRIASDALHVWDQAVLTVSKDWREVVEFFGGKSGWLDRGIAELERMTHQTDNAGNGTVAFGGALHVAASAAQVNADALKRQNDELQNTIDLTDKAINGMLGLDNAQLAVSKGWKDLSDAVAENGKHWNDNTDAAFKNRDAILQQIANLERVRESEIAAHQSVKDANATFSDGIEKILGYASALGATKAQLDQIRGTYEINLVVTSAAGAISSALSAFSFGGHRAAGGPVSAGSAYMVGERGPEMFVPGGNGYIDPKPGGGVQTIVVSFANTGDTLLDAILRELRQHVRINGGSADVAFS